MVGTVLLCVLGGAALAAVVVYNGLVRLRVAADGAWSDTDVQLRRRHDLVPNVVETVRGDAAYGREAREAVIGARAMAAGAPAARGAAPAERAVPPVALGTGT
jgi:LemA protein